MESLNYQLSHALKYHSGSVRTLSLTESNVLLSGAWDSTCVTYFYDTTKQQYLIDKTLTYHLGPVYSSCTMVNNKGFFSGGNDAKIYAIDLIGNPIMMYEGHAKTVNSLSQFEETELVSGSWDATAKVWDVETGKCKYTLEDHAHAVAVMALENGLIVTGSQDKQINFWSHGKKVTSFQAHDVIPSKDIIRQIIPLKGVGFATCSNDESVKLWDMSGKLLQTLKGHNGFIYTLAFNSKTGEIVTGSEDNTVKIWKDSAFVDSIQHPGTVWSVVVNPMGDIITACEDREVRMFTRDAGRGAPAKEREEYNNQCIAKSASKLNVEKLPDAAEKEKIVGRKDGEIKLFRTGMNPEVYVWKEAEQKWEKMGDVMGPSPEQKDFYEGDEIFPAGYYDYIFNIDIKGRGEKKLPFNKGSIPLEEAEKFVERENIHKVCIEEISAFIRNNLEQVPTYMAQAPPEYQQEAAPKPVEPVKPKQEPTTVKHLPMIFPTKYEAVNVENPLKKITEFNNLMKADPKLQSLALAGYEEGVLNGLMQILKDTSTYHLNKIGDNHFELLSGKLMKWPLEYVFPVIDVVRMMLMHPTAQAYFGTFDRGAEFFTHIIRCLRPEAGAPLLILTLRCMCNMFEGASTTYVINRMMEIVLGQIGFALVHKNKNVLSSASSLLLNASINEVQKKEHPYAKTIMELIVKLLSQDVTADVLGNAVYGIGNIVTLGSDYVTLAKGYNVVEMLKVKLETLSEVEKGPVFLVSLLEL